MSSILDALNKLEEEKALAQSTQEGSDLDPESAAEELVGPSVLRDRITLRFTPLMLIVGGLISTVVIVFVSVAASLLVVRSSGLTEETAVDSAAEGTSTARVVETPNKDSVESAGIAGAAMRPIPTEESPAASAPAGSELAGPASLQAAKEPSDPAAMPAEIQEVPEAAPPLAAPEATRPDSAPEHAFAVQADASAGQELHPEPAAANEREGPRRAQVVEAATEPAPPAPLRAESASDPERLAKRPEAEAATHPPSLSDEVAAVAEPPLPSLAELPILTPADRARYADGPWMVNMVNPASETNPYGHAVINANKVFEGQTIPGTQFRLIGVEMRGIGVAVQGTTKRFFIPW